MGSHIRWWRGWSYLWAASTLFSHKYDFCSREGIQPTVENCGNCAGGGNYPAGYYKLFWRWYFTLHIWSRGCIPCKHETFKSTYGIAPSMLGLTIFFPRYSSTADAASYSIPPKNERHVDLLIAQWTSSPSHKWMGKCAANAGSTSCI